MPAHWSRPVQEKPPRFAYRCGPPPADRLASSAGASKVNQRRWRAPLPLGPPPLDGVVAPTRETGHGKVLPMATDAMAVGRPPVTRSTPRGAWRSGRTTRGRRRQRPRWRPWWWTRRRRGVPVAAAAVTAAAAAAAAAALTPAATAWLVDDARRCCVTRGMAMATAHPPTKATRTVAPAGATPVFSLAAAAVARIGTACGVRDGGCAGPAAPASPLPAPSGVQHRVSTIVQTGRGPPRPGSAAQPPWRRLRFCQERPTIP